MYYACRGRAWCMRARRARLKQHTPTQVSSIVPQRISRAHNGAPCAQSLCEKSIQLSIRSTSFMLLTFLKAASSRACSGVPLSA